MNNNRYTFSFSVALSCIVAGVVCLLCLFSCANRGMGPQGGPKDETPPKLLKQMPENGSVNFVGQEVVLVFDEYVQLNDVSNQVLISPPSQKQPVVKAVGKKVVVSFEETLRDSSTYSIDFGSAICDNNEKNPLTDFVFAFSTGDEIDTLQMSGTLINAEDLNPVSGIYIGLHSNLHDSAFATQPFDYIARTAADGSFCVRNVRAGAYRIYALNDVSKDFMYQPGEALAFLDTVFVPVAVEATDTVMVPDTAAHALSAPVDTTVTLDIGVPDTTIRIFTSSDTGSHLVSDSASLSASDTLLFDEHDFGDWRVFGTLVPDSQQQELKVDSVPQIKRVTHYEPSGILLKYFAEDKQRHYFQRCIREEQHCFRLLFAAPQDSLPVVHWLPLKRAVVVTDSVAETQSDTVSLSSQEAVFDTVVSDNMFVVQASQGNDTVTYWLTDSLLIKADTLSFVMTYIKSDSLYNLVPQSDTVNAVYRAPRMSEKAKEALERKKKNRKLELKSNANASFDIYRPLQLRFPTPLSSWVTDSMHMFELRDSVRQSLPFVLEKADSSAMVFSISHDWKPETEYFLELDSAAFTDVYGVSSDRQQLKWTIRPLDDYSSLTVKLEPFLEGMMIQVLSEKDVPVRTARATAGGVVFRYLKPQSYYVRAYEDLNGDSLWTTGDWEKKRQPEPVYYFPVKLVLRANWDFEETFNWQERAVLEQKPEDIRQDAGKKKK